MLIKSMNNAHRNDPQGPFPSFPFLQDVPLGSRFPIDTNENVEEGNKLLLIQWRNFEMLNMPGRMLLCTVHKYHRNRKLA